MHHFILHNKKNLLNVEHGIFIMLSLLFIIGCIIVPVSLLCIFKKENLNNNHAPGKKNSRGGEVRFDPQ